MICDNCLFLKPVTGVLQLLPDADRGYPYEGSKTLMVMIDCVEDQELMAQVMERLYQELPEGKIIVNQNFIESSPAFRYTETIIRLK